MDSRKDAGKEKSKGRLRAKSAASKNKRSKGAKGEFPPDRARERFREIFDNILNAVAVCRAENDGQDFIVTEFNKAAETLEKVDRKKLIGKNIETVFPGVASRGLLDVFRDVYQTGRTRNHPISFYEDDRIVGWRENHVFKLASGEIVAVYSDETEKKQAEIKLVKQGRALDAINRIFRKALLCDTQEDLARTCLDTAQFLTDSQFGFIGEMNPDGCLDTIAISNPGWETCRLPESEATVMINDMELRGIWASVIKNGQSLIANNPASHPDSIGVPEGHPPLTAFLGVPLKEGDRTFGIVALGNKKNGYNRDDQTAIEALSVAVVETFKSKRREKMLQRQAQEIMDLSTPVMQVWEGVVVVPLIGILDTVRTDEFMERFLKQIVITQSSVALVDITGVPTIDTQTAQHLTEAISAARLLGTQVILTGVRPAIAQTLVHLGIDLRDIATRASLAAGLKLALDTLNLTVLPKSES
jgi:anti-anti-sigma regulatory factor